jgi:hypothetical protein
VTSRSQLYPLARQLFATAGLNWATANIKACVLAAGYTPDFTQRYLSGIPFGAVLGTTPNITGKTGANGLLDGNTASFGVISSPSIAGYILFYEDTGNPATSPLIMLFDTPDVAGLPQALTGLQYFLYANLSNGGWARL